RCWRGGSAVSFSIHRSYLQKIGVLIMKLGRSATYAWGVLAYNLAVIVWGAYVRATSSGDGCGSHWLLRNGELIPRAPKIQTLIEFTHRITSGLSLVLVLLLVVWFFRCYAEGEVVRSAAAA